MAANPRDDRDAPARVGRRVVYEGNEGVYSRARFASTLIPESPRTKEDRTHFDQRLRISSRLMNRSSTTGCRDRSLVGRRKLERNIPSPNLLSTFPAVRPLAGPAGNIARITEWCQLTSERISLPRQREDIVITYSHSSHLGLSASCASNVCVYYVLHAFFRHRVRPRVGPPVSLLASAAPFLVVFSFSLLRSPPSFVAAEVYPLLTTSESQRPPTIVA